MKYFPLAVIATLVAVVGGYALIGHVRKHSAAQENSDYPQTCRALAEHGDVKSQYELGRLFFEGRGVPQDYRESLHWYRAAADQAYAPAQSSLGFMYEQGLGVPRDYAEALQWYHKAADRGNPDAEYNLGTMYRLGMGVSQDSVEAVKWYRIASSQGDANGQYALGYMYYNGKGVQQDFAMAAHLYRQAADQGLARAQYDLAYMYYDGRGVEQSRTEADRLLHQAAALGEPRAQRSLGVGDSGFWATRKVISAIIFLGCFFFLITSLFPNTGRNLKSGRRRIFTGIVGLLYAGLDLYLSFSNSIDRFGKSLYELSFARYMLLGIFSVLLILVITHKSRDVLRSRRG